MGLFSHKDKSGATAPEALYFVVYLLPVDKHGVFREEFDHAFGRNPQVTLSFSRPPGDVASKYSADSANDQYLTVTPRETLSAGDKEKVIQAVRTATKNAGGSSMCPVR